MNFLYVERLPRVERSFFDKFRSSYEERERIKELTGTLMYKVFSKYGLEDSVRFVESYRELGIAYYVFEIVWPDSPSDTKIEQIGLKMLRTLKTIFENESGQYIHVVLYVDRNCLRFGVADTKRGYDNMVGLIEMAEEIKQKYEADKMAEKRRKEQAMQTFRDRGNRLH